MICMLIARLEVGMDDIIKTTKMVLTITLNSFTELGYYDPRCWTGIKGIWHLNEIDWEKCQFELAGKASGIF